MVQALDFSCPPSGCPHLGKHVRVGVILQKHRSRPGVVVAGRDVQGREAHLPLRPVVDEVCHHVLVALLQSHGQRGEAVLARGEEERSICSDCGRPPAGLRQDPRDHTSGLLLITGPRPPVLCSSNPPTLL